MKRIISSLIIMIVLLPSLLLSTFAAGNIPRIVDNAGLLSMEEVRLLENAAESCTVECSLDVAVLTIDSLNGKSIQQYADDYYENTGYGIGPDWSGALLVVSMGERELYISTCGSAIDCLSDQELDAIIDEVANELSYGNYYKAFHIYYQLISNCSETFHQNSSEDGHINWLLSAFIGIVVAGITILIMRACMNTKRKQHSAGDYLKSDSYHLHTRQDIFLYSNVSKVKKQQNNTSSTHTSSSGRSHGGRGGRF